MQNTNNPDGVQVATPIIAFGHIMCVLQYWR